MGKSLRDIEHEFLKQYQEESPQKKESASKKKVSKHKVNKHKGSQDKRKLSVILDATFYAVIIITGLLVAMMMRGGHLVSAMGVNEGLGVYYVVPLIICVILIAVIFVWRFKIRKKI